MATLPFMKWYPRDFYRDPRVMALSTSARWAYRELLDIMWMNEGWVAADDKIIARLLGIDIRMWRRLKPEIAPMFAIMSATAVGEVYTQKRLTKEINAAEELVERGRKRTAKARASRWESAGKSTSRPSVTEASPKVSNRTSANSVTEAARDQVTEPVTRPYTHSSDKEAADAAANHKASKEAAASLATGALHPREEARPDVDERDQRRGAREDHQELPKPQRAMGGADPGASSLYARLAAERRRRATEDGKEED